uniref:Reverse transcriptase domain-containing protein n=1 Tax=Cannabis sativa TaxID=3483 RepID=A0A803PHL0_CANSA
MALKLDMSKAYDRIEWVFLEAMLKKLGFEEWWTCFLMKCVTSACYTVVHGNREMGPIIPSRGIRQGDPLSLYLFILCAKGLSTLLHRYENGGLIHSCKVANGAPHISHMLFTDDSYLYCKATMLEATRVQEILIKFEVASGRRLITQNL